MIQTGRIIEERKTYYNVDCKTDVISASLKGIVKKKNKRIFVGDIVDIEVFDDEYGKQSVIRALHSRKNSLKKPAVANIDQVYLLITIQEPVLDYLFIDRFLFNASVFNIPVVIVVNKMDILQDQDYVALETMKAIYSACGHDIIVTSAETGEGLDAIINHCSHSVSIFAGASGVGKSSLLALLFPNHEFRTQELSKGIQRGVHTTTHTSLLKLSSGGYIADTPGFSFVDLSKIDEWDVADHFPDIANAASSCRFNDCSHDKEPKCAVKEALEQGFIAKTRYTHFRQFFDELRQTRRLYR